MQNLLSKILKILKDHVNQNNQEIQYNQNEIKNILNSDELSESDSSDLDFKNGMNEELFKENDDFLQMQLQFNEFIEKYSHLFNSETFEESEVYDEDSLPYFAKTVQGELKFRPGHPQFSNPRFFKKLLKYYEEKEDYEMCDELIQVKRMDN